MPTMITFRAATAALLALGLALAACSGEQQDWRSAEAADTTEAYARFIGQHPDSELAAQARGRMSQLAEERDWQRTRGDGTLEAYRAFLAHYPSGRYSQEARIRIESAALGSIPRIAPQSPDAQAAPASGVKLLQFASAAGRSQSPASSSPAAAAVAQPAEPARPDAIMVRPGGLAQPGEPAQPADGGQPAVSLGPAGAGYAVQLGAFGTHASADREWQRLQNRFAAQLAGFTPRVVAADTSGGELYRLQVAAAGEAQARALCDSLKQQSQSCVPVVPR
jgi:cell division septation protein DedD